MDILSIVRRLFDQARSQGGDQYVFTLVRIDGITHDVRDPLLVLRDKLDELPIAPADLPSAYADLLRCQDALGLVVNLINCTRGMLYNVSPLGHLNKVGEGTFEVSFPSPEVVAQEVRGHARREKLFDVADLLDSAFPDELVAVEDDAARRDYSELATTYELCRDFLTVLLDLYFQERLTYRGRPRLAKRPRFLVRELIVDNHVGLCGVNIHHSNGTTSHFFRGDEHTDCADISFGVPVGFGGVPLAFHAGDLDQLRDEWRVGDKRLYEVGLGGRYNELGEWKPIVFPGNADPLRTEAEAFSDDELVQGSFFYILATGHRVIEFVISGDVELPSATLSWGDRLHLWRCPMGDMERSRGRRHYDGWFELEKVDADYIGSAIATISVFANRIALMYGSSVEWRVKYSMVSPSFQTALPSAGDLKVLDSLMQQFPSDGDAIVLDAAIEWYSRGIVARNVIEKFFCYFVSLESVASAVADGKANLGLLAAPDSKATRLAERRRCIKEKHDEYYATDPELFVREAYFDCVVGLTRRLRRVMTRAFGEEHEHLATMFEKGGEEYSLAQIRSLIAHGGMTLLDREQERLVRRRVPEIARIAKEFLVRAIFLLKPGEEVPSWSGKGRGGISFADPRSCLCVSREDALPSRDWRIRPEWCD